MNRAFVTGFWSEITKLAAKPPTPWHHKIPGRRAASLAMKGLPLVALGSLPLWAFGKGLGKGLGTPAQQAMPWEERY